MSVTAEPEVVVTAGGNGDDDAPLIDTAFIMSDGKLVAAADLLQGLNLPAPIQRQVAAMEKSMPGSQQVEAKDLTEGISLHQDMVNPPYDPGMLAKFLDADETHFRCVKVKVTDSVGRTWVLTKDAYRKPTDADFDAQSQLVLDFMDGANEVYGVEGVLEKASMDYEAVGWGAIEVVRSMDKRIKHLFHVPAARIRVLKGWTGFVELGKNPNDHRFYLPFGRKVLSPNRRRLDKGYESYDPVHDAAGISQARWNLRNKKDLNERLGVREIAKSANELLFIPKQHPKSIYYGVPDFIPAIGSMMGNLHIRDFLLQFFDHNTVPQYAIIIKGAKLTNEVRDLILSYFTQEIKGQAHKTLIIPIPAAGGDVDVVFQPLQTGSLEGSFQETRRNNQRSIIISHGLSPAIVGDVETANLGAGKGTAQQINYKNRVVDPLQKRWSGAMNRLFRFGLGAPGVNLEFDSLDAEDQTEQQKNLTAFKDAGTLSINDMRERAKIGAPIPGGSRPFVVIGEQIVFVDQLEEFALEQATNRQTPPDGGTGAEPEGR